MKADLTIDAKGLSCPMPIVRAKKGIDQLNAGEVMELITTDPGSVKDFQSWVNQTRHELLEHREDGGVYTFYVKKAE